MKLHQNVIIVLNNFDLNTNTNKIASIFYNLILSTIDLK